MFLNEIQKEPVTRMERWKRTKIYKIPEWMFFLLLDSTDIIMWNCSFSMLSLGFCAYVAYTRTSRFVAMVYSTGLTLRSFVVGNFLKLCHLCPSLFPWLQGQGLIKISLPLFLLLFASMWPASQSCVIDLRKTSLKSPLLFSGWQNCYVFT